LEKLPKSCNKEKGQTRKGVLIRKEGKKITGKHRGRPMTYECKKEEILHGRGALVLKGESQPFVGG